ncbi:hypothetical protein CPB84DRAFT_357196 [Gymnopilus junonius]|uniref:Uncharacterized protein n=1 Tax=Gymnopilus junonius TaxID=109634 RepID=A0A9P5THS2_GYMJU|nr:hypothetical protein CPB84DRAFT_357196 [Gymnopilus junonius]
MTIAETDAIFARAYASAIKKKLQLEVGEDKVLFLSPLVQRGIPAGSLIPPEITNFEVYAFGDTLLTADNPSYFGGGGNPSYIQDLRTYVDYIYTKIDWSPGVTQHMAEARKAVADAEDAYSAAFDKAMAAWKKAHDAGISTKQFWPWTRESAPYLDSAEELRKRAYTSLDAAAMQHYGPQAATLADIRAGLRDALETDPEKKYPG